MFSSLQVIWKEAPFVRLIIPFIAGVLSSEYSKFDWITLVAGILVSFVVLLIYGWTKISSRFLLRYFPAIPINLLLFLFGLFTSELHDIRNHNNYFEEYYKTGDYVQVIIIDPPEEKKNSFKSKGELIAIVRNNKLVEVTGKLHLYFSKENAVKDLERGSVVLTNASIQPVSGNANPGTFDYKKYSALQNIHHQVYLRAKDYFLLHKKKQYPFSDLLDSWRNSIVRIIQRFVTRPDHAGLAQALLIGYKKDLDPSLTEAYTNTGVVHIIAISGMHLGLIYLLLNYLTGLLKIRNLFTRTTIILCCLWIFSFLTGASASVLRSAVMFSFIAAGGLIKRESSAVNSLFASAFLLLSFFPTMIYDIGFQLSYAAVLSLIVLMKPIYDLIYVRNPALDQVWKLVAGTIAAQVFTLPLVLSHFHQFPLYFILANMVAVPLSSLILLIGILLCLVSFIPPIANLTGSLCSWLIQCMNDFVMEVEKLPSASLRGIQVDLPAAILLYVLIIGLLFFLRKITSETLILFLSCLLLFVSYNCLRFFRQHDEKTLIVYNAAGAAAVGLFDNHASTILTDSFLFKNRKGWQQFIEPSLLSLRSKPKHVLLPGEKNLRVHFGNLRLIILQESVYDSLPRADVLLVAPPLTLNRRLLASVPDSVQLICQRRPGTQLQDLTNKKRLAIHVLSEKGAFVITLN